MHAPETKTLTSQLIKADPASPVLKVIGRDTLVVKAGTSFRGKTFDEDTPVLLPKGGLVTGADYVVALSGEAIALRLTHLPDDDSYFGGFHFAPGGNAAARAGGDDVPAINPFSLWDVNFRPACKDPRGMVLIELPAGKFWCDIYLTGADCHLDGTSKFGATIADGRDCPINPATGERFKRFDYAAACAVMAHHGKGLLATDEFRAAAEGVTENSAAPRDPNTTGLDAIRTSRFGLMQATGNMWVWGHDGDPDSPRASLFGGSWIGGDSAGSRYAYVGHWPENSLDIIGARGRSDHLQLDERCDSSAAGRARAR